MTKADLVRARAALHEAIQILDAEYPDLADLIDPVRRMLTESIDARHNAEAE